VRRAPFCVALLVRNELGRYLKEVLDHHAQFGPLVVLDDNSDDGTYEVCHAHPAMLRCERRVALSHAWGAEAPARQQLWQLAADAADWHLVCDADQLLSDDPRPLTQSLDANAWAFPLYDLWNDREHYREDHYWRGHLHPRPWLFNPHRVPAGWQPQWSARGIHVGHFPSNFPLRCGVSSLHWLHLAYVTPAHREEKLARYRSQYPQMTLPEQHHAESIGDKSPSLRVLPFAKPIKVLIGGPVRKNATILKAHLDSLAWQELPKRVQVSYAFVDDYPAPDPGQQVLQDFIAQHKGTIFKSGESRADDFTDQHPVTHQWSQSAMGRVGRLKHALMKACIEGQFDYLWLVDSDLLCDKTTLASLLGGGKLITSAVYWTRWNTDPKIHAGPQVWLKPPYQLSLPHYPETDFRRELAVDRTMTRVGGLGACTLIHRQVIEKGINYEKPPGFPSGGLMDGEDRHFCEWARRMHVELWADPWPDIFHVYHPSDAEKIPLQTSILSMAHPQFANHGHLVSVKLTNLEDGIGPVHERCRIGDGKLLPELEQAILTMRRGDTKVVRTHFPSTFPTLTAPQGVVPLAGAIRLIQIELLDCKPFGLAPVVADEFHMSAEGPVMDATTLSPQQLTSLQEQE
jgi:hypothetical protein